MLLISQQIVTEKTFIAMLCKLSGVRPLHTAARCAHELMCILQSLNGGEGFEWLEKKEMEEERLGTDVIAVYFSSENIIIDNIKTLIQGP